MIPKRKEIELELFNFLTQSKSISPSTAYKYLEKHFKLDEIDIKKKTKDGESYFEKEVRWAKKKLVDSGVIKKSSESGRGTWELAISPTKLNEDLSPILVSSAAEMDNELSHTKATNTPPIGQKRPDRVSSTSEIFVRDVRVVAYVLKEANGICEVCKNKSPFFKNDGTPYLEIHHLRHLADGGSDTVQNTIAVCPNCHRELHFGVNKENIKENLYLKITRVRKE